MRTSIIGTITFVNGLVERVSEQLRSKVRRTSLLLLFLIAPNLLHALEFDTDIEPIFTERCLDCHGPEKQKGQFRIDRRADLLRGGDSGEAAVVPGKPEQSFLLRLVEHKEPDLEMPAKGKPLAASQIKLLRTWIAEGAKTPERYGPDTAKTELTHWSLDRKSVV